MLTKLQACQFGILCFLGGISSCNNLAQTEISVPVVQFQVNVTEIQTIQAQQANDSTVHLRGRVINQVPLLEGRVYQLQDETGAIWVLTRDTVLQPGDEVLIRGTVRYQSIPLAGRELGEVYVEEQERLERSSAETSTSFIRLWG